MLVADDTTGWTDVVLVDRTTHQQTVVSLNSNSQLAHGSSSLPSLSADGRFLAFRSRAND